MIIIAYMDKIKNNYLICNIYMISKNTLTLEKNIKITEMIKIFISTKFLTYKIDPELNIKYKYSKK